MEVANGSKTTMETNSINARAIRRNIFSPLSRHRFAENFLDGGNPVSYLM